MKSVATNGGSLDMWTSGRIAQYVFAMLVSSVAFAGDAVSTSPGPDQAPQVATPASLLPYSAQWLPDASAYSLTDSDRYSQSFTAMDFRDDSALARLGKIRNLSLLTLAETRRSRVFLGVNADGLVGLHFVAFAEDGADRYLSLVRLPYLKKKAIRK